MQVQLVQWGHSLSSRARAATIREALVTRAEQDHDGLISIDFSGVKRCSYSFIDELVGKLRTLEDASRDPFEVALVAVPPQVAEVIEECEQHLHAIGPGR